MAPPQEVAERAQPARTRPEGYVGVLLPAQANDVVAPYAGVIEQVHVALGDQARNGQVLVSLSVEQASLDRARAKAEAEAAQAGLARARIERRHAALQVRRTRRLAAEGLASQEELAQARFKANQSRVLAAEAESKLEERRAREDQLRAIEEDAQVAATFPGRVAVRYVDPGARVSAGAPLLRLISEDKVVLRFAIPEDAPENALQPGQTVSAVPKEGVQAPLQAVIVRRAPEIDSASRMRTVEAVPVDPEAVVNKGLVGAIVSVSPGAAEAAAPDAPEPAKVAEVAPADPAAAGATGPAAPEPVAASEAASVDRSDVAAGTVASAASAAGKPEPAAAGHAKPMPAATSEGAILEEIEAAMSRRLKAGVAERDEPVSGAQAKPASMDPGASQPAGPDPAAGGTGHE